MNSLRRDIHTAIEVMAPPLGGMPERVVETVLADKGRRRNGRMLLRFRAPLSLVAALVVIALVAAVLIGGRIVQDWNVLRSGRPAGHSQLTTLQQLEARPLHLPVYRKHSDCVGGPYNRYGDYGSGPLFGSGGSATATNWGQYFHDEAYALGPIPGPILVRIRDLFTHETIVFVGNFAAGPVVGTDTIDGTVVDQHSEMVLYTDHPTSNPIPYAWLYLAGHPKDWSGSTGWQVDGVGFSEVFVKC